MAWNNRVPSEFTIPPLEQLDPTDPRWEQAFEIKMASKAQQRRDRDEESDSMYSDDIEFANLVTGTMEEQQAAMDACNDGDNDSIVCGSDADSCFDDVSHPLVDKNIPNTHPPGPGSQGDRTQSWNRTSMENRIRLGRWRKSDLYLHSQPFDPGL